MKVYASKTLPSTQELVRILNQEFSGRYSCRLFGLGKEKTIMVRASTFVGTQISIHGNEITVQGTPPSIPAGYILTFIGLTELVLVLVALLGLGSGSSFKKLEKEIAVFLYQQYK
jgi:hypothetical protein